MTKFLCTTSMIIQPDENHIWNTLTTINILQNTIQPFVHVALVRFVGSLRVLPSLRISRSFSTLPITEYTCHIYIDLIKHSTGLQVKYGRAWCVWGVASFTKLCFELDCRLYRLYTQNRLLCSEIDPSLLYIGIHNNESISLFLAIHFWSILITATHRITSNTNGWSCITGHLDLNSWTFLATASKFLKLVILSNICQSLWSGLSYDFLSKHLK